MSLTLRTLSHFDGLLSFIVFIFVVVLVVIFVSFRSVINTVTFARVALRQDTVVRMEQPKRKPFDRMSVSELERSLQNIQKLLIDKKLIESLPDDGLKLRKNAETIENILKSHSVVSSQPTLTKNVPVRNALRDKNWPAAETPSPPSARAMRLDNVRFRTAVGDSRDSNSSRSNGGDSMEVDVADITATLASLGLPVKGHGCLFDVAAIPYSSEAAGADQGTTISPSDPQPTEHGNDGDVTASRDGFQPNHHTVSPDTIPHSLLRAKRSSVPTRTTQLLTLDEAFAAEKRHREIQQEAAARLRATVATSSKPMSAEAERLMRQRAAEFFQYRDTETLSDEEEELSDEEDVIEEEDGDEDEGIQTLASEENDEN